VGRDGSSSHGLVVNSFASVYTGGVKEALTGKEFSRAPCCLGYLASFWCEMLRAPVSGAIKAPYCTVDRRQP
jgi:hypothetical protein